MSSAEVVTKLPATRIAGQCGRSIRFHNASTMHVHTRGVHLVHLALGRECGWGSPTPGGRVHQREDLAHTIAGDTSVCPNKLVVHLAGLFHSFMEVTVVFLEGGGGSGNLWCETGTDCRSLL